MATARRTSRSLAGYRGKRKPGATPEPFGGAALGPHLFVVQQHAARRLHHDFRLEWQGALLSWAVPRGPSLDPAQKRLAVQVEEHPVEYADFEGVIPEGSYGAGAVIVWDRGRWTPLEDVEQGLERGKLLFELTGYKLRGRWTLVRTGGRSKRGAREWLLIKKADAYARSQTGAGEEPPGWHESVLSGLSLDDLRRGNRRGERCRQGLARLGAPRRKVDAARVRPMLAERCEGPFSREGWIFEVKYDGYRCIAGVVEGEAHLYTRQGRDTTRAFPEVASALSALPYRLVLDGEIVAADDEGRPDFQSLQRRARLRRSADVQRAAVDRPVTYFVFDLLAFEDYDLRPLPLLERKKLLEELLPSRGPVRFSPHFEERGEAVYAEVTKRGLEGIVAKQADSPYRSRRSRTWRKVRALQTDDFVVVGFTAPRGERAAFGALHLAAWVGEDLVYAGRVGSGFAAEDLAELHGELAGIERAEPPCPVPASQRRGGRWVEPRLVCEVRYAEITAQGLLRQPVFLRRRDDKAARECRHPGRDAANTGGREAHPEIPEQERKVPFTNLSKVFWPAEGITKGDLLEYHRRIAPWILPYLRDRPLVLTRYPDGIEGKSFFQKDAPRWVPSWVRTERMWSEQAQRDINYFVCDELDQLLYVVNLGAIPLHVWSSRVTTLQRPDWCILDLDPKEASFRDVIRVARALHVLCRQVDLPCFVKTSGASGLHLLLPLGRLLTYEQSRALAGILARIVVDGLPEIATLSRSLRARRGRVYVDTLQNGHGRLLAAPFCVRPLPGAPVSMPLRWSQVKSGLSPDRFTLRNASTRMRRLKQDPLLPVLEAAPDLLGALELLKHGTTPPAERRRTP